MEGAPYASNHSARNPRKRYGQRRRAARHRPGSGHPAGIDIVPKLADKCAHLRIFEDEDGKLNRSAVELGYSALVVSNFTLYGDTARGKRPSFSHAAKGELAVPCYEKFLDEMNRQGLQEVKHGEFGADMQIDLVNDGPVTIVIDTDEWKK